MITHKPASDAVLKQYSDLDMELLDNHTYVSKYAYNIGGMFKNDEYLEAGLVYHDDDILIGNEGNDIIIGEGSNDIIYGRDDDDIIMGDNIVIKDSIDIWNSDRFRDKPNSFYEYSKSLEYQRKKENWIIEFSGNDRLYGGKGNDHIYGGLKSDYIEGNEGDDVIYGDSDLDTSYNEYYYLNDSLKNVSNGDTQFIYNYYEIDTSKVFLHKAGSANHDDTIFGGEGNDTIYGQIW